MATVQVQDINNPVHPQCPSATVMVCQNGDNKGKRYFVERYIKDGKFQSDFRGWIDAPAKTWKDKVEDHNSSLEELQAKVQHHQNTVAELVKDVEKLKKKIKQFERAMDEDEDD